MKFKLLVFFILVWFFRGFIGEYIFALNPTDRNISDPYLLKFILEIPIILAFLLCILNPKLRKTNLSLGIPVLLYFIWSTISAHLNSLSYINAYLYSRYFIYSYMLYVISYRTVNSARRINILIVLFFTLSMFQIFISIFNYSIYGMAEGRIGTIALNMGSLATIFPLTVTAFSLAHSIISKKSKWLVFSFLFLIMGFASGKRALLITLPFFMIFFILLAVKFKIISGGKFISTYIFSFILGLIVIVPLLNFYLDNVDFGQSSNFKDIGVVDKLEQLFNYANEYELGTDARGLSRGRTGTNMIILFSVFRNNLSIWGIGPMKLYDQDTRGYGSGYTPMGILYGIVGWGKDAISIGIISVFFVVWYIILLFKKNLKIIKLRGSVPISILTIALGCSFSIIVFVYDYFIYSANSSFSGFPLFVISIGAGIIQNFYTKNDSTSETLDFLE